MADIRNDQYLHRPGAGRGAITPADPLESQLYDDDGNPVNPATEETLGEILDAVGAPDDSAQTDPAQSASQIALLKGLLSAIQSIKDTDGVKKIIDAVTVSGLSELAKETTLGSVKSAVESIAGEDFATETTLSALASSAATETTLGAIKTAAEALAALIDSGALQVKFPSAQQVTLTGRKALGRVDIDLSDDQVHDLGEPPAGATQFFGRVEGGSIRAWWDGGESPTTTSGVLIEEGETVVLVTADDIANFEAIQAGGSAKLVGVFS